MRNWILELLKTTPVAMMTWTIQRPIRDGWYRVRKAALEGWEGGPEPRVVHIYGFADGEPTITIPSEENCSDLADIDAEWAEPLEVPR